MDDGEIRKATKVIFAIIPSLSLLGNSLVLLLFVRFPSWLKKAHNQCILSLAITDILTAISLFLFPKFLQDPDFYPVASNYIAREIYCRTIWSLFIPFSFGAISVYTCLVLAIERWFAVVKPLQFKHFSSRMMPYLICCSWLAGFASETPIIARVEGFVGVNGSAPGCRYISGSKMSNWILAIALFLGQSLVPCCAIGVAYSHMFLRLRAAKNKVKPPGSRFQTSTSKVVAWSRNLATRMMATASFALIVSWMPNQIHFLLMQLGYRELEVTGSVEVLMALAFCNCFMNPIIYGLMHRNFREGYQDLFKYCLNRK